MYRGKVLPSLTLILLTLVTRAEIFNVKKFGAAGDGKTDDTWAIQEAINQAGRSGKSDTIFFPKGTYLVVSYKKTSNYLENYLLLLHSNLTIMGTGSSSVIKLGNNLFNKRDSSANAHIFYGKNITDISFTGIVIDMNGKNNPVPENFIKNHCAIFISNGNNFNITNSKIINCAGRNMIILKGNGKTAFIQNNSFINGGRYTGTMKPNQFQSDFSFVYSEWSNTLVAGNLIRQNNADIALTGYTGGVEIHGSNSAVLSNTIYGCYPAVYISSSWYHLYDIRVEDNLMQFCVKGISFWVNYPVSQVKIANNKIDLTYNRFQPQSLSAGIEVPNGNSKNYSFALANNAPLDSIIIENNQISSLFPDGNTNTCAGIVVHSLYNSIIQKNKISGMNYAGVVISASKWGCGSVHITNNLFYAFRLLKNTKAVSGYFVITDTYTEKGKAEPGFKNIVIEKNETVTYPKIQGGNFYEAFIALPEVAQKQIRFNANNLSHPPKDPKRVITD
ncbi:MAG TPA: glycosyl hydrolase family 28-related protein [Ferruginibacter sp.]|nr:glycosyl hydrolase family 28-related protein [Ferruginibacter sp.]HMP19695.1 glycosyl hydrolase family 28-related protein [Ferruginibacter sp.]